jgi:uncharacterized membrane protein YfcA
MTGNGGDRYRCPMPIVLTAAVLVAAAAGGFAQRASGLGFSLIAAPLLALAAGPRDGVSLTNLLALVVALAVFATSVRRVDRARAAILIPAGLAGVALGTIVFRLLPASWLQVAVGAVTGLGLAAAAMARRLRLAPRPGTTAAAGLASGVSSAVAGAGGPPLTIYAIATGWPQPLFAATAQVSYALQAAAALALKGIPPLPLPWLGAALAATLAGVGAAHLLAPRIDPRHARRAAIGLAAVASALTVIRGVTELAGR